MRVSSFRLILLLTLLSGFVLDLTALEVVNHPTPYTDNGIAAVPNSVPRSPGASSVPDAPLPPALETTREAAVDSPTPSGFLFLLILAAVTTAATMDVLSGEIQRRRPARPEWLALNLFARGRLDGWEELHWSEATGPEGSLT